jgi:4-hydroxybenzoate polyprenyltransferase
MCLYNLGYAFLAFSFCASSVYLINDIVDLPHDRQHPTKCNRPLAAGKLSLSHAWLLVGFLLCGAALLASLLPIRFAYVLLVYLVLTALYSFWLKKIMVLDVLLLASFYAIRILGGGDAIAVPVSEWLLMFSMFIFVSLGCVKRFSELYGSRERGLLGASGRGYVVTDIEQLAYFGTSAGYLSVLVFALYINSDEVTRLYTQPQILWLICPLLLYWISRGLDPDAPRRNP